MFEKIKNLFRRRSKILTFKNWQVLDYATIYEIIKINETWALSSVLLFDNGVLVLPLNVAFDDPEHLFLYLQILGPMFHNIQQQVIVVDGGKIIKRWDLGKTTKEQGMTVEFADFLKELQSNNKIVTTHDGTSAVN
jgi:hypothetical protein